MRSYKWVISSVTIVITHIRGLITPVITTHEPPSTFECRVSILLGRKYLYGLGK